MVTSAILQSPLQWRVTILDLPTPYTQHLAAHLRSVTGSGRPQDGILLLLVTLPAAPNVHSELLNGHRAKLATTFKSQNAPLSIRDTEAINDHSLVILPVPAAGSQHAKALPDGIIAWEMESYMTAQVFGPSPPRAAICVTADRLLALRWELVADTLARRLAPPPRVFVAWVGQGRP